MSCNLRVAGGFGIAAVMLATSMALGEVATATAICPPIHLTEPRPFPFVAFGKIVAVQGDTAMVTTSPVGAAEFSWVYVLNRTPTGWTQSQVLTPPEPGGSLGSRLAMDGDWMVTTGGGQLPAGGIAGCVHVYKRTGSQWTHHQKLFGTSGGQPMALGPPVAIDGDVILASRPFLKAPSGAVYIFRYNPSTGFWAQEQKLTPPDSPASSMFGSGLAVQGDVALIGVESDDNFGAESGSAYVYRFNARSSSWQVEQKLLASDAGTPAVQIQFGVAVSLDDDMAVVGAESGHASFGSPLVGACYLFRYNPRTVPHWTEIQKLNPPDQWAGDFGFSVALQGSRLVIGARSSHPPGSISSSNGAAYFYRFDSPSGLWVHSGAALLPSLMTGFFGHCVALDGRTALIGAYGEAQTSGAAYVYTLDAQPADLNCDGHVSGFDLAMLLAAWGRQPGSSPADLDDSGFVNGLDLGMLLAAWGK